MSKQSNMMRVTPRRAFLASLEDSCLTAKNKRPHTIAETSLPPAAIKMKQSKMKNTAFLKLLFIMTQKCDALNQCQKASRNSCGPGLCAVQILLFKSTNQQLLQD
jgi:hypothetical protein